MSAGAAPGRASHFRNHDLILPTPASPRGFSSLDAPLAEAAASPGTGIGAGDRERAPLRVGVTPLAPRAWRGAKCPGLRLWLWEHGAHLHLRVQSLLLEMQGECVCAL